MNSQLSQIVMISENAADARDRLIERLYDCKTQSDHIYAQTRLLARFASPFRFELTDRLMHIFAHKQRRLKLARTDNGESIAFTFHDDDTVEIAHTSLGRLMNVPHAAVDLKRALVALDLYL